MGQASGCCFHCGLPLRERKQVHILGAERELCCTGCEAVARTIVAAGLESYYETRSSPGAPPADAPSVQTLDDTAAGSEASLILERVRCTACLWLVEQTLRRVPGV